MKVPPAGRQSVDDEGAKQAPDHLFSRSGRGSLPDADGPEYHVQRQHQAGDTHLSPAGQGRREVLVGLRYVVIAELVDLLQKRRDIEIHLFAVPPVNSDGSLLSAFIGPHSNDFFASVLGSGAANAIGCIGPSSREHGALSGLWPHPEVTRAPMRAATDRSKRTVIGRTCIRAPAWPG